METVSFAFAFEGDGSSLGVAEPPGALCRILRRQWRRLSHRFVLLCSAILPANPCVLRVEYGASIGDAKAGMHGEAKQPISILG